VRERKGGGGADAITAGADLRVAEGIGGLSMRFSKDGARASRGDWIGVRAERVSVDLRGDASLSDHAGAAERERW
jgi:hypothetical protein